MPSNVRDEPWLKIVFIVNVTEKFIKIYVASGQPLANVTRLTLEYSSYTFFFH